MANQFEDDNIFEVSEVQQADVILCLSISLRRLPRRGKPVVAVSAVKDGDAPFDEILKAWLPPSATLHDIAAAIHAAAAGLTVLTAQQAKRTFHLTRALDADPSAAEPLTVREIEVLQMLAAGLSNKAIAARLRISANTAKFHVAQILAKLGVSSRAEAVSVAIRRGAVPI